jgi:preprotein translocase subunit SecD
VAPPSRSGSRPGRALAGLAALILIMLISILGGQTFSPGNWHNQFKVGLGLDLSSGTQVVLKAATPNGAPPSTAEMQASIGVLLNRVNGTGNSGAQVQTQGDNQITVTVPGQAATNVVQLISTTAYLAFRPVLLIQPYTGTPAVAPKVKSSGTPSPTPSGTATGTAKPTVSPTPSVSSTASAKASTSDVSAKLDSASATSTPSATPTASATTSATAGATTKATATPTPSASASSSPAASATTTYGDPSAVKASTMKLFDKLVCTPGPNANTVDDKWKSTVPGYTEDLSPWNNNSIQTVSCDAAGTKYVLGPAVVKGTDVTSVNAELDTSSGQWIVNIGLNSSGAAAFGKLTTNQFQNYYSGAQAADNAGTYSDDSALDQIGIALDGDVQSAPQTDGALTSGSFEITGPESTGGFTQAEATQLQNVLKFGALPLTFTLANETSVSPQVGHASLDAGLLAGILGLFLVVIYLFYYYRGLGIVSVSSLLIAALLAYFSVVILSKYQNFTMSLSAIAGLVVAIGITADSFIVYFERLRDEVREGKTLRPAVEAGWKRARRTILVSDTVSFLAAVLLYHFATSDVQGFAYTLGLTTIIDVVVVFLFTKPMVTLLAGTKFFSSGSKWSGLDPERLGAKSPWRGSGARRYVRAQRPPTRRPADGGSSTSKEA